MGDADVSAQKVLVEKEFLRKGLIDDDYRSRAFIIRRREFAPLAQRNLDHVEVTGADGEVAGRGLLPGLWRRPAFDHKVRLAREGKRQIASDSRRPHFREAFELAKHALKEGNLASRLFVGSAAERHRRGEKVIGIHAATRVDLLEKVPDEEARPH